jgi:hypothetical protein
MMIRCSYPKGLDLCRGLRSLLLDLRIGLCYHYVNAFRFPLLKFGLKVALLASRLTS